MWTRVYLRLSATDGKAHCAGLSEVQQTASERSVGVSGVHCTPAGYSGAEHIQETPRIKESLQSVW